jgi:hypothetical protein
VLIPLPCLVEKPDMLSTGLETLNERDSATNWASMGLLEGLVTDTVPLPTSKSRAAPLYERGKTEYTAP